MVTAKQFASASLLLACVAGTANAGTITTTFQATIASEQHPTYAGEARYYHVSVNPSNPGTGSYAATIVGTNNPAPTFVRPFAEPVVAYKFAGGVNNDITVSAQAGGDDARIVFSTTDTSFDGFGQQQAKLWTVTDPGSDIQTTIADPYNAVADASATGGFRSLGGAVGTFDISGLATGAVNFYYGAFSSKPTISAIMRDLDGNAPDVIVADAHLNGDAANRTEYYLAELTFDSDNGVYDQIIVTWDSDGDGDLSTGNGRGVAAVLTGTEVPEPGSIALLGIGGLLMARRRRCD